MALIPVRSREPINGKTFVTEVGEEHLERWPEDYVPLEGDELIRYQLAKAGVADEYLEEAVTAVAALTAEVEHPAGEVVTDEPGDDEPSSETPTPAGVDPSVSTD